jgi:hypothetical protein
MPLYGVAGYIYGCMYKKVTKLFISSRHGWKEGTCCALELAGIEPTPPAEWTRSRGAGYARLHQLFMEIFQMKPMAIRHMKYGVTAQNVKRFSTVIQVLPTNLLF